jgi:hypothetical protein
MNQWPRRAAAFASIVMTATWLATGPATAGERCGLGAMPGTAAFAEQQARDAAEMHRNGFLRVCAGDLKRYEVSFSPIGTVSKRLAFQPVELARTPFASMTSLGASVESVGTKNSRLYRGFRLADGHRLTLFEHDMSADGTSMWRDPKDETDTVNGHPARLSVLQSSPGKAVSVLSWLEGRRYYELWLDANVALLAPLRTSLFTFAASLPLSVPACPGEAVPGPVRIGADGMPVLEPPPAFLTAKQVQQMFAPARPCK